ncbi:MAG: hypothetical protein ACRDT8_08420 [Micromonosporaceae bacterium]
MGTSARCDPGGFAVVDDLLDLIAVDATDLLGRVDLVIEHLGMPVSHPVHKLLRTLRARPGEVLRMLLATPPGRLMQSVAQLRSLAETYHDGLAAPLDRAAAELGWGGSGHQAFTVHWAEQMRHLSSEAEADSMASRLRVTADFVESVAGWFSQARQALAEELAPAFSSAEAVVLKSCEHLRGDGELLREATVTGQLGDVDGLVTAAAEVGRLALRAVAQWYEKGMETFVAGPDGLAAGGWSDRLSGLPGAGSGGRLGATSRWAPVPGDHADGVWVRW